MIRLEIEDLFNLLRDPVLDTVEFLNEAMARFPDAISFAPGAPHTGFYRDINVSRYIEAYLEHRCRGGLTRAKAVLTLFEYGPSRGIINDLVADAIARDHGITVGPGGIVITVGAQEAMLLVLRALCWRPEDLLAVAAPCYVGLTGVARLIGIELVCVDDREDGVDLPQLDDTCRTAIAQGRRVRAVYVAPDFANPSGTVLTLSHRRALLDLAERHDLILVEDNAYAFTSAPDEWLPPLKALDAHGRVIFIGTFAKLCLPGARVGFVVADQPVHSREGSTGLLADRLAALKTMTTVNTSPICQAVVGGMLLEHGVSLHAIARVRSSLYRRNLALLTDLLDSRLAGATGGGVSWSRPSGGFFVRMRIPVPADLALLAHSASRYRVLWTPMAQFYPAGGGVNELRLSCSYLDPAEIEEGVDRLASLLRGIADQPSEGGYAPDMPMTRNVLTTPRHTARTRPLTIADCEDVDQ